MCEPLRIGLIAEGPTDAVVIEAALNAILDQPFVLTTLQPEPSPGSLGTGWCGVLRWCQQARGRSTSLEQDPTLGSYDLFVLHLDADVAEKSYEDCSGNATAQAHAEGWGDLPCDGPCPPPQDTTGRLRVVLLSWLGQDGPGPRTVFCTPSKAIEAWLAAALFPDEHPLLQNLECSGDWEGRLARLSLRERVRRSVREYRRHARTVRERWAGVRTRCQLAEQFHEEMTGVVAHL